MGVGAGGSETASGESAGEAGWGSAGAAWAARIWAKKKPGTNAGLDGGMMDDRSIVRPHSIILGDYHVWRFGFVCPTWDWSDDIKHAAIGIVELGNNGIGYNLAERVVV